MNPAAFVLASTTCNHFGLFARPWVCGRSVAAAPATPFVHRVIPRFFACEAAPAAADVPQEASREADASEGDGVKEGASAAVDANSENEASADPNADSAFNAALTAEAEAAVTEPSKKEDPGGANEKAQAQDVEKRRRRRIPRTKKEVTLPMEDIKIGMELEGTVRSVMSYGAFVGDMGTPTDGLLHVSQLAAGYVENVTDVVNVGDKVKVRVLGVDKEKRNLSLTMKSADDIAAPRQQRGGGGGGSRREEQSKKWAEFKYDPQEFVSARVTSVADFGGFCQLLGEDGEPHPTAPTEGLIHISEISESRVQNVSDVLSVGQTVKVRVVSTDRKRNRISMSMKEYSESSKGDGGSSNYAQDIADAESKQPEFKSLFELAFEKVGMTADQ